MNELESLRETCKTFPQQYQSYLALMGETHNTIIFEEFVDWVFQYRPNIADVNSLRKNKPSTSLEERERSKNQSTCEKSRDMSFSVNEESINTFLDHMVWVSN